MKKLILSYTTDSGGAATAYADGKSTPNQAVVGELCGLQYVPGSIDTGATVTLTCENTTGGTHTLWNKATVGTSNLFIHPRELTHNPADGAALTGTAGGDRAEPIVDGYLKVVIASGGDTKSGAVLVYID